jgi:hypothetical protein
MIESTESESLAGGRAPALALLLGFAGAAFALAGVAALAAEPEVPIFKAHYLVEYKGHKVGREELSVTYDSAQHRYRFESRTEATGVLKLVRRKPSIQRTDFILHDGAIRPLEFWLDDGTRKGEDDRHIVFDWDRSTATVTDDKGKSTLTLEPNLLDPGTILVAIMLDLSRDKTPGPYSYTDGDAPSTYRYTAEGEANLEVEAGRFDTAVIDQTHEGSSRHMRLWTAPKLGYLPVRIVQYKGDELLTALTLESVEGLDAKAAETP